jgi:hypothetical protein
MSNCRNFYVKSIFIFLAIYADQQLSSGVFKAIEGLKKQISKELEAQKFMSRIAGSMDILIHQQPNS